MLSDHNLSEHRMSTYYPFYFKPFKYRKSGRSSLSQESDVSHHGEVI